MDKISNSNLINKYVNEKGNKKTEKPIYQNPIQNQDRVEFSSNEKTNKNRRFIIGASAILSSIGIIIGKKFLYNNTKQINKKNGEIIYNKIKSLFKNQKQKYSPEIIDNNLKPKQKPNSWAEEDMKSYYTELEKNSIQEAEKELIQKHSIDKVNTKHKLELLKKEREAETEKLKQAIDNTVFDEENNHRNKEIREIIKGFAADYTQLPKDKTIEELSLSEKNNLVDFISSSGYSSILMQEKGIITNKLLPKNENEYIEIINKLTNDIKQAMMPLDNKIINTFKNKINNLITSDLSNINSEKLADIEKMFPEIFNNGRKINVETVQTLRKIFSNPQFNNLSEKDKQLMTIAALMHNTTNKPLKDIGFDSFVFAQKYGFNKQDSEKLANIIKHSNFIEKFMSTNNKIMSINRRNITINTTDRVYEFLSAAKDLHESNSFEMAQMLYSTKDKEGLSRLLDSKLKSLITKLKSCEEIYPQTDKETILKYAHEEVINGRKIMVANANDIPNFYAYVHTHNLGMASWQLNNSKEMKLANFKAFEMPLNDKLICTSYVGEGHFGTAGTAYNEKNGLILKAKPGKTFVNSNSDIYSLSKNENDMIYEFGFRPKKVQNDEPSKSYLIDNATNCIRNRLKIDENEYAKRINQLKESAGETTISYDFYKQNDSELLEGTEAALEYILHRSNSYSESLLSNPELTGIFKLKGTYISDSLLDFAVKNNLPLVIFN